MKLFNSLVNKVKRKSSQISFNKRSKNEHDQTRNNANKNFQSLEKQEKSFNLIPKLKINLKFILIPLLIVVLIGAIYYFFLVIKAWVDFTPKTYTGNTTANTFIWEGDTKLTILLVGTDQVDTDHAFIDALGIYSIDPVSNKFTVFMINPDLKIYMSSLGKDVNFRTVLNDNNLTGDKMVILKNAISTLLAVKIDRYVLMDKSDVTKLTELMNPVTIDIASNVQDPDTFSLPTGKYVGWKAGNNELIWGSEFLAYMASDSNGRDDQLDRQQDLLAAIPYYQLSLRSIFNIPQMINALNEIMYTDMSKDEIESAITKTLQTNKADVKVGFTRSTTYNRVAAVSFYPVYSPNLDLIDADVYNIFFDMNIFKEQAKIEILNSSGIKGLANNRARWIVNLGGRVVKVGNGISSSSVTRIYCENPTNYTNTIIALQKIFNNKAELIKTDYPNRHVGDIVVELGKIYE